MPNFAVAAAASLSVVRVDRVHRGDHGEQFGDTQGDDSRAHHRTVGIGPLMKLRVEGCGGAPEVHQMGFADILVAGHV